MQGRGYGRLRSDLMNKVSGIASVANIPQIQAQKDLIDKIINTDYVERAGIDDFENIRENLRNLMKYVPKKKIFVTIRILRMIFWTHHGMSLNLKVMIWQTTEQKAEHYIRQHQDNIVIAKLRTNEPLTHLDVESLEKILWSEVGSKRGL